MLFDDLHVDLILFVGFDFGKEPAPNLNASTLLLYHLYEVGFKFWDTGYAAALTMVMLALQMYVVILPP
mgnify:CR=1 FL=1